MIEPTDPIHTPDGTDQLSLFGLGENRMQPPVYRFEADLEIIRQRLNGLLATARGATVMPWPERDARMWQTVFPQMANWLPDEEANQLRFEFVREIERLKSAA